MRVSIGDPRRAAERLGFKATTELGEGARSHAQKAWIPPAPQIAGRCLDFAADGDWQLRQDSNLRPLAKASNTSNSEAPDET